MRLEECYSSDGLKDFVSLLETKPGRAGGRRFFIKGAKETYAFREIVKKFKEIADDEGQWQCIVEIRKEAITRLNQLDKEASEYYKKPGTCFFLVMLTAIKSFFGKCIYHGRKVLDGIHGDIAKYYENVNALAKKTLPELIKMGNFTKCTLVKGIDSNGIIQTECTGDVQHQFLLAHAIYLKVMSEPLESVLKDLKEVDKTADIFTEIAYYISRFKLKLSAYELERFWTEQGLADNRAYFCHFLGAMFEGPFFLDNEKNDKAILRLDFRKVVGNNTALLNEPLSENLALAIFNNLVTRDQGKSKRWTFIFESQEGFALSTNFIRPLLPFLKYQFKNVEGMEFNTEGDFSGDDKANILAILNNNTGITSFIVDSRESVSTGRAALQTDVCKILISRLPKV